MTYTDHELLSLPPRRLAAIIRTHETDELVYKLVIAGLLFALGLGATYL